MENVEMIETKICELLNSFLCHKGKSYKEIYEKASLSQEEAYALIDIVEKEELVLNIRIKRDKVKKPIIVFTDNAEVSIKGLEYIKTHSTRRTMAVRDVDVRKKPTVFLSYNWGDKQYADFIEERVGKVADLHRDINNIDSWGSIERFMRTITDHDYVILLISQKYIESLNCMYEAWQLCVNDKWSDKVMCIITDNVDIYSPESKLKAVKYWVDKCEEYKNHLLSIPDDCKIGLTDDLRKMEEIKLHAGEIYRSISSRQNPSKEEAVGKICEKLVGFEDEKTEQVNNAISVEKISKATIICEVIDWLAQLNKHADRCSLELENALCKNNPEERWTRFSNFSSMLSEFSQDYNCLRNKYKILLDVVGVKANIDDDFREATKEFINSLRELGDSYIHKPDTSESTDMNNKIYQKYVCAINHMQEVLAEDLKTEIEI